MLFWGYQLLYLCCVPHMGAQCKLGVFHKVEEENRSYLSLCSYLSHFSILKMSFLPVLLSENPAEVSGRWADNAYGGLKCRNSKWEEQKKEEFLSIYTVFHLQHRICVHVLMMTTAEGHQFHRKNCTFPYDTISKSLAFHNSPAQESSAGQGRIQ